MKTIISTVAFAGLFSLAACNTSALKEKETALSAQQQTIDSMKVELAKQKVVDSMNELNALRFSIPAPTVAAPAVRYVNRTSKRSYSGSGRTATPTTTTQASNAPVVYQPAPVATKKKGWSAKAKGAVIGAGTGAVAGAVINKRNRVAGAVIGGILGAGAGTGIGAILDKKNGR
jgi:hypothetical protein